MENLFFQPIRQVPSKGSHRLLHLVQLSIFIDRREALARYLQVDLPIIMGMGDSEGLDDPGVKGILLELAHPRHDTRGMSRERACFHRLRHSQGIDDHPDNSLQMVMLITLGLEDPSHFGKLLL